MAKRGRQSWKRLVKGARGGDGQREGSPSQGGEGEDESIMNHNRVHVLKIKNRKTQQKKRQREQTSSHPPLTKIDLSMGRKWQEWKKRGELVGYRAWEESRDLLLTLMSFEQSFQDMSLFQLK